MACILHIVFVSIFQDKIRYISGYQAFLEIGMIRNEIEPLVGVLETVTT
jgi:hypothetical protein